MALDLITGHQGVAHISAEQISDINKAMMNGYGDNKVMRMSGGAITQNALTLEIATGYWRANGFDIQIQESETHYIDPSTIGTSRIDNIYVELLQDIPTGAQRAEITIIMGEEGASPVAPEDPTEPYLNTDILLDAVQIGTVTVTEGAMVFTDMTEAYDLVTPSDLAAVQTLATNALGMIQDDSDAYSSSKAYAVGDLCIHDDVVYKCITACSAAAWSVNQNCFSATTLTDEVSTLKDALNNKQNSSNAVITRNTLVYVATGTAKFNIGSDSRFDITKPLFGFVNKSDIAFDFCIIPYDGLHIANGYSALPIDNIGASASIRFYNNCTQVGINQVFINGVDETADAVLYLYTQI